MASGAMGDCERLHDLVATQAASRPHATALWWQGNPLSYADLNEQILELAGHLAISGSPGDRVAVLAWNCPEFVQLIYAVPAAGRILVPLNARLAPAELAYQLRSAGVSILFADPELLSALRAQPDFPADITTIPLDDKFAHWRSSVATTALPPVTADEAAWILYTSGSTGRPRGAILTHRSFLAALRSAALCRPVDPGDRYLYPFPLFHVAAHNVLLQHQYGAAVVLMRSFNAEDTLKTCRQLQVSTMSLAPTMIGTLLDHPDFSPADLVSVHSIGYGASAMPETLLRRLLAETGIGLCQSYGMTELSGSVVFLTIEDHRLAAGSRPELLKSVGRPLPTAQVKVVNAEGGECAPGERGEIMVLAEQCMLGYWGDPEATAAAIEDGWLHTGDIGRFDAEGYLYVVDRLKDMIISGGENIASREVEEVLRCHPGVKDCAVIGLPDPRWGEAVCAVVQLSQPVTDSALSAFCRQLLAGYKTPKTFYRVDALPVNAGGKIDKPLLRRRFSPPQRP